MEIRDRIKELRRVKACDLKPNPKNWRTHPEAQASALRGILSEVGYVDALLARETADGLELIDGHLRAETTPDAEVPVLILDVTDEEADKILATFDPLAAMAEADEKQLENLLRDLETESDGLQAMLDELAKDNGIVFEDDKPPEDPGPQIDRAEELRKEWGTERGQLWEITGKSGQVHRLLCGDSTNAEDVGLLMGDRASMCFTSPPYGAGNVAKLRDHYVKGSEKRESFYDSHDDAPDGWLSLMDGWWAAVRPVVDFLIVNVQLLADNKRDLLAWVADRRDELVDIVVWDKGHAAPQMSPNVLSNAFEFVLMFGGNGSRSIPFANFHGTIQNVIRIDPKGKNENAETHRAVMPIALPLWAIGELCRSADSVVDPFSGTGTTIIAAEQLNRRCYGIEISPAYCAVILQRMKDMGAECKLT